MNQHGARLEMIDFWRGLALAIIFINHIPNNFLVYFTPRNFGFSDCAEALVFISGLSAALAYGKRFASTKLTTAALPIVRRIGLLYTAHLLLTALGVALFAVAYHVTNIDDLFVDRGRLLPFSQPLNALVGVLTFRHQLAFFDILPLYIILLALTPFLIVLGLRSRWLMLMLSLATYSVARIITWHANWMLPGDWFFNPFTWQFLYTVGIFVGLSIRERGLPYHRGLYYGSLAFTTTSAILVSNLVGLVPGLLSEIGEHLDLGKTELGIMRIADFLTLGYVLYHTRWIARLRDTAIFSPMTLLGRHGLAVFCAGTLLSAVGQIITELWPTSKWQDMIMVAFGLAVLYGLARLLELRRPQPLPA